MILSPLVFCVENSAEIIELICGQRILIGPVNTSYDIEIDRNQGIIKTKFCKFYKRAAYFEMQDRKSANDE